MRVGELLYRTTQAGITLTVKLEGLLNAKPTAALTPELIAELEEHKQEIIQILLEDAEYERTGILQCERQVFDLAREHFGLRLDEPSPESEDHIVVAEELPLEEENHA
jgi:hypothetical protein